MNEIALFVKKKRREMGLTQREFAVESQLGLRFVRELEQGKETVRMDKVNQALAMFGAIAIAGYPGESEKMLEKPSSAPIKKAAPKKTVPKKVVPKIEPVIEEEPQEEEYEDEYVSSWNLSID